MLQHWTSGHGNKGFGHRIGQWFPAGYPTRLQISLLSLHSCLKKYVLYSVRGAPAPLSRQICGSGALPDAARINRTMLSSGTAEANGQITEATFHISLHRSIYQRIDRVEETENFTIFFEKTDHRFVQSVKGL